MLSSPSLQYNNGGSALVFAARCYAQRGYEYTYPSWRFIGISVLQYADDTQSCIAIFAGDLRSNVGTLHSCLSSLGCWCCHNGIALNSDKSEATLLGTKSRLQNFLQSPERLNPQSNKIGRTFAVTLDSSLTLSNHISAMCRSAHFHTSLSHIPGVLTDDMAKAI